MGIWHRAEGTQLGSWTGTNLWLVAHPGALSLVLLRDSSLLTALVAVYKDTWPDSVRTGADGFHRKGRWNDGVEREQPGDWTR